MPEVVEVVEEVLLEVVKEEKRSESSSINFQNKQYKVELIKCSKNILNEFSSRIPQ